MERNIQSRTGQTVEPDVPPPDVSDVAALTAAMSKGDEMAYRNFHEAYFGRLLRYLLVVANGDEEVAREALQLTFLRVVRHIKLFQREDVFWSWLTVLARSALADERRKSRRYFSFLERFTCHARIAGAPQNNGEADDKLHALLESGMASLPEDERRLIENKYAGRRSVREIAGELGTTEKAVESKLSRVRAKLKDAVLHRLKNESSS